MTVEISRTYARFANEKGGGFASTYAPRIREYFEAHAPAGLDRSMLDIGCGPGHLCHHFCEHGYASIGADISEEMLVHARARCDTWIKRGLARFVHASAQSLAIPQTVSLAVSTYNALNELPDMNSLCLCFSSVFSFVAPGGAFIFDLNTRAGLMARWNYIAVTDTEEWAAIERGVYDGGSRATYRSTGFMRRDDGLYDRFAQIVHNTVFETHAVRDALTQVGFRSAHCASGEDFATPVLDAERLDRVFVVAWK